MGQYWLITNPDKKEFYESNEGLKLTEYFNNNRFNALGILTISPSCNGRGGGDLIQDDYLSKLYLGRWFGDRICIVGDYMGDDDDEIVEVEKKTGNNFDDMDEWEDISVDVNLILDNLEGKEINEYDFEGHAACYTGDD